MLRAHELSMQFGRHIALSALSCAVAPGQIVGLLGENGAGKTTALRLFVGLYRPASGYVEVDGARVEDEPARARARIGYLPETLPLYPEMRIGEYLDYRGELRGMARAARRSAIARALKEVNLLDERDRPIRQLSKGMIRRVGLADALLAAPPILLLDEPTDGLDPHQRRDILALVKSLGRDRLVVLSTHVLPEAESLCTRLLVLRQGRLVADGATHELLGRGRRFELEARAPESFAATLRAVPDVIAVTPLHRDGDVGRWRIEATSDVREACATAATAAGGLRELRGGGLDALFDGLVPRA